MQPKLDGSLCCFRTGCSTVTDQIFALQKIFDKSWKYAEDAPTCFLDHKKAYDRVPGGTHWEVLRECGVDGRLLLAVKSLYSSQRFMSVSTELNHNSSP